MAVSKPLVLADSQGKYFEGHLAAYNVDVRFQSGLKIQEIWGLFQDEMKGRKVRILIIID